MGLYFKKMFVINYGQDDIEHVIWFVGIKRNYSVQLGNLSLMIICTDFLWRIFHVVGR